MCVFIYSGFFAYTNRQPVIPSFHTLTTGEVTISTGLSRSFCAIMELDFKKARSLNFYGPQLFIFFLIQLLLRFFFNAVIRKDYYNLEQVYLIDIVISTGMFLLFFEPFIKNFLNK